MSVETWISTPEVHAMVVYAHSRNSRGIRHELPQHLTDVAAKARSYADKFGAGELARWTGIWHDIGKFHPDFQKYLLDCEATPKAKRRGPDHKRAGATLAAKWASPLLSWSKAITEDCLPSSS